MLHRPLVDEEPIPSLNLADAIRVSSNIAMVKFAARLTPDAEYTMLRDFGLGPATGVEFPAEAGGAGASKDWRGTSQASWRSGTSVRHADPGGGRLAALAEEGVLMNPR